ncbi:MAG: RAD55 family ATPase [Candidatus Bathyarchaeia archaeon]
MYAPFKVSTGVSGLDEILGGGLPAGRVILILGGPGTGKTILATQFVVDGLNRGEGAVFVSLDETKFHYYSEMSKFGWNLEKFEKDKKFSFLDASPIRHLPGEVKVGKLTIGRRDFSMLSLIEGIKSAVKEISAKRLVVDPIASLIFQYPDPVERRTAMLDLVEALVGLGTTSILTSELSSMGLEREVQLEEYLAHGVILLETFHVGRSMTRAIQVEKMREAPIDHQPRPYRITEKGFEVFSKESVF